MLGSAGGRRRGAAVVSGSTVAFPDTVPGETRIEGGRAGRRGARFVDAAVDPDGRVDLLVAQTVGRSTRSPA